MGYQDDSYDDDDEPAPRKRSARRPGSARARDRREKQDLIPDMIQQTLAACAPRKPGQIYPVMPGNNGSHTEDTIEEALVAAAGRKTIAAGWLGMRLSTLENRINNSERLLEVIREIEEMRLDVAETQLDALVMTGSDKAVTYMLTQKGKHRGYGKPDGPANPNSLTLDAARELEAKLVGAFAAVRQQAVDAVIAQTKTAAEPPMIEAKAEPVPAPVAEPPADKDEFGDATLD